MGFSKFTKTILVLILAGSLFWARTASSQNEKKADKSVIIFCINDLDQTFVKLIFPVESIGKDGRLSLQTSLLNSIEIYQDGILSEFEPVALVGLIQGKQFRVQASIASPEDTGTVYLDSKNKIFAATLKDSGISGENAACEMGL